MTNRKQKIEELVESMASLRRSMAFRGINPVKAPRITPSQWSVLMLIEQRRVALVKDVAAALGISSSASTQLVDGLVKSGYVVRKQHAEDRRTVSLVLSAKTKRRMEEMKKRAVKRFLEVFAVLNDREFSQYLALNRKIVKEFLLKKAL